MPDVHSNDNTINIDNTFTDMFSLIKKYNQKTCGIDYTDLEMSKLLSCANNAVTSLLHGLQSIGKLVATSSLAEKNDIMHIGYFLTMIGNLLEALHLLRLDCEHGLSEETIQLEGVRE